jgi:hypothetical protein
VWHQGSSHGVVLARSFALMSRTSATGDPANDRGCPWAALTSAFVATDAAEPAPEWRQGTNGESWEAVLPSGEFQEAEPRLIAERMQTAGECRICGRWVEQLWMAVLSLYVPPETQLRWLWGCTPDHAAAGAPRSWSELAEAFAVRGRLEDRDAAAFLADA